MQISLQNVVKTYVKKKPVLDASFGFQQGRVTGLLGHNGAGKTTAIKIILGLLRQDSGLIQWGSKPISEDDRAQIGYMPETLRMPRGLTCEELLIHQCKIFDTKRKPATKTSAKERVQSALANVGLLDHKSKLVDALSKGMGRKLAWALATISNPKVLILDEPFSGLDPHGRIQMEGWMMEHKNTGTTIILSTHDLHQASRLCDDVVVLKHGQIVYSQQYDKLIAVGGIEKRYKLAVKGATEREIQHLFDSFSHTKPEVISAGYAHELICSNYENAATLAQKILTKGWILSEMSQIKDRLENDVKKFFVQEAV